MDMELLEQIEVPEITEAAGIDTVIITESDLEQPFVFVSVTVKEVVVVGLTVGFDMVETKPIGELAHRYLLPETADAPILVATPEHIEVDEPAAAVGNGFTTIVTEFEFEQP